MDTRLFGEFMGTLVLVLIGNGTVANVVLKKTLGSAAGWLTIVFGFGLGVVAGVFIAIACGSSDAHINPAVTLGIRNLFRRLQQVRPVSDRAGFGRHGGGMLVWIHFLPHWKETPDRRLEARLLLHRPCHSEYRYQPHQRNHRHVSAGADHRFHRQNVPAPGLVPFLVGATVWAIGAGLGGTTGFAINPARDLGPRIAHAILPIPGKGGSDFAYGLSVPVLGGLIGGGLAGLFIRVAHL